MNNPAGLRRRSNPSDAQETTDQPHLSPARPADIPRPSRRLYERVVRVVAYLFIAAALVVVGVSNTPLQPLIYVLAAAGLFLVVVGQDMLPSAVLGGRRLAVEAAAMIVFVSVLVVLTGGYSSPFFVGYVLVVGAASLWGDSDAPLLLAAASCLAYLAAVLLTPFLVGGVFPTEALARVAFILVAIGLVSYVASVISREQRRSSEAALALSRFDGLTQLFSRSYFERALEQEVLRAGRTGRGFSMLLLDLDALKSVNDRHGHDAGDRLLSAIGEVILGSVRATDTAARLGGDEFVVILPETDGPGAMRVAEKLRRDIGHLSLPTAGTLVGSSVSIGVVGFPDDARNAPELLRRADQAMYQAKRRGKDQIYRYVKEPAAQSSTEAAAARVADAARAAAAEPVRDALPPAEVEVAPAADRAADDVVITGDAPWQARPTEPQSEVVVGGRAPWEQSGGIAAA